MKKKDTHKDLGFEIPEGYFESNIDRMFDAITQQPVKEESPFAMPDQYFENLENRIIKNTLESECTGSSDVNESGFEVPAGYFDTLEQRILENTVDKPVVQMKRETVSWIVPLLAVAAIFITVLSIDGLFQGSDLTIQDLHNDELVMYLSQTDFTADEEVIDILYTDTDALENIGFNSSIDNEVLLDYLSHEVDMNQMFEE